MLVPVPRLYAIADAEVLARRRLALGDYAAQLRAAGVTLLQYRDKDRFPQEVLRAAARLSEVFEGVEAVLIMNDRADLAVLAGFDGVHVGQGDLSPEDAKRVLAGLNHPPSRSRVTGHLASHETPRQRIEIWGTQNAVGIVGVSTHTEAQVIAAETGRADYVAVGPVFATGTKRDAEAVVGLEGVRRARALTSKPLVAIGGITRANARSVIEAGADSVAIISGLLVAGEPIEKVARDFIELLG